MIYVTMGRIYGRSLLWYIILVSGWPFGNKENGWIVNEDPGFRTWIKDMNYWSCRSHPVSSFFTWETGIVSLSKATAFLLVWPEAPLGENCVSSDFVGNISHWQLGLYLAGWEVSRIDHSSSSQLDFRWVHLAQVHIAVLCLFCLLASGFYSF